MVQFKSAFRKLLSRAGACTCMHGGTGNCLAQDMTELVSAATHTYVPPDISRDDEDQLAVQQYNMIATAESMTAENVTILENVVVYMAGYVATKIAAQVSCTDCYRALFSDKSGKESLTSHCLLTVKDRGGLIVPSAGLIKAIKVAEKCIRYQNGTRKLNPAATRLAFQSLVLATVGTEDIFCIADHALESMAGIDNHQHSLLRLVAGTFSDFRIHHVARSQMSDVMQKSIRNKLTRSVIFMGQ